MIFRKESIGKDPGPPKQVKNSVFQKTGLTKNKPNILACCTTTQKGAFGGLRTKEGINLEKMKYVRASPNLLSMSP